MATNKNSVLTGIHDDEYISLCNKYGIPIDGKLTNFKYIVCPESFSIVSN